MWMTLKKYFLIYHSYLIRERGEEEEKGKRMRESGGIERKKGGKGRDARRKKERERERGGYVHTYNREYIYMCMQR